MGVKDEIKQAKVIAEACSKQGLTSSEIVNKLNLELEGFYYYANGSIYRENIPDYAPALKVA